MNKKAMLNEIDEIIKEVTLDKKIVAELNEIKEEIEKEAGLDEETTETQPVEKVAKLISTGCRVVCVNPLQGPIKGSDSPMSLYKGRYYKVIDADTYPGYLVVAEEDAQSGSDIGIFEVNRFLLDTHAF